MFSGLTPEEWSVEMHPLRRDCTIGVFQRVCSMPMRRVEVCDAGGESARSCFDHDIKNEVTIEGWRVAGAFVCHLMLWLGRGEYVRVVCEVASLHDRRSLEISQSLTHIWSLKGSMLN